MKKGLVISTILIFIFFCDGFCQWRNQSFYPGEIRAHAYDIDRGVVIVLDDSRMTWEWNGLGWVNVSASDPDGFLSTYSTSMAYDAKRKQTILVSEGENNQGITWKWNGSSWMKISGKGPVLGWHHVIYDYDRQSVILFNDIPSLGERKRYNETWSWNGKEWKKLGYKIDEVEFGSYFLSYDFNRKRAVLLLKDWTDGTINLFELEHNGWRLKKPTPPGAFAISRLAYNPRSGKILLQSYPSTLKVNYLEWDGKTWTKFVSQNVPDGPKGSLIPDLGNRELLSVAPHSIWKLARNKWHKIADYPVLPQGVKSAAFDIHDRKVFIRYEYQYTGANNLYKWDGLSLNQNQTPDPRKRRIRSGSSFLFNQKTKQLMYFGGRISVAVGDYYANYFPSNDTWVWNGKAWREIGEYGPPEPRSHFAVTCDQSNGETFVFGGNNNTYYVGGNSTQGLFGDLWMLKGAEWSKLSDYGPRNRSSSAMSFDEKRNMIVLYGGEQFKNNELLGDTWEWDGKDWQQRSVAGPQPRRIPGFMTYNPVSEKTMLYGGVFYPEGFGRYINEMWEWDGSNWRKLKTTHGPELNNNTAVTFDSEYGRLLLFNNYQHWTYGPYRPAICSSTDFDGDGTADPAVFNQNSGKWSIDGAKSSKFGERIDTPFSGDFDGDGKAERAFFRTRARLCRVKGRAAIPGFCELGDVPVPGDYNGDGKDDIALFRPKTGLWKVLDQFELVLGKGDDVPVPADYNGDGITDIAVYRPRTGQWLFSDGSSKSFGGFEDIPVPADYDGDGKAEIAVYQPQNGIWLIKGMDDVRFGLKQDIPVPADYNGDGRADIAVYRPNTGEWVFLDGSKIVVGDPRQTALH